MIETNKIYVDIESLLDLRQGILFEVVEDKEALIDFLLSGDYNYRDIDSFSIVTDDEYKEAYSKRSKDILPASALSHVIAPVRNKILSMEKMADMYSENKRVEVVLNVYPFELTQKEREHIRNLFFIKLQTECLITVTEMTPKQLSPTFLKQSSFLSVFMYDFPTWINLHSKQLEVIDIKKINMYFPALQQKIPSKEDMKKVKETGFSDMFSYTEFLLSRFINVSFLPVVFYSNLVTTAVYLKDLDKSIQEEKFEEVDISGLDIPEI